MKSVIEENKTQIKYPCLMMSKQTLAVVLFVSPSIGTTVSEGLGSCLGYHTSSWDMNCFEHFHGTVTLSND